MSEIDSLHNLNLDESIYVALSDSSSRPVKISIVAIDNKFPDNIKFISDREPDFEIDLVADCIDYTNSFLDEEITDYSNDIDRGLDGYLRMVADKENIKAIMFDVTCNDLVQISDIVKNLSLSDSFCFDILDIELTNLYLIVIYRNKDKNKYESFKGKDKYSIKNKLLNNE